MRGCETVKVDYLLGGGEDSVPAGKQRHQAALSETGSR